ncbi:MAG TPA: sugar transferase [Candidatus Dormibacteraeota bacterium]|nr:sugar transferase [Candidatus Dormibacteraeota bacterium]
MDTAAQGFSYAELAVVESPALATGSIAQLASPAAVRDVEVAVVRQPVAKRVLDLGLASMALLILSPMLVGLMVAVAFDTRATPVFVQVRTGRGGRRFRMYKLRTMVRDAESRLAEIAHLNEVQWPMFKIRNDPRITRLGRFLRAASLDELPQLLNIVKGDMSLVGPRPPLPHEVATYTDAQARRLSVLPGLTGLWQVSGRAECSFEQAVALDLSYIDNHRVWTDITIMLRTFGAVFRRRGAY